MDEVSSVRHMYGIAQKEQMIFFHTCRSCGLSNFDFFCVCDELLTRNRLTRKTLYFLSDLFCLTVKHAMKETLNKRIVDCGCAY